jgi:CDP-diacylglycerol--glycerol-3-phosphate 3-phosphatidyltransferase
VLGWLPLVYVVASPLARWRVPADLLTATGLVTGAATVVAATAGGRWLLLAAVMAVLCGVLDGLDGAVANLLATSSAWGHVFDSFVDRCTDLLLLGALWVLGAAPELCVATGSLTLLQESVRASAAATGLEGVGVLTVWERPSRLILATLTFLAAGVRPASAAELAVVAAGLAVVLASIGVVQLLASVRRRLRGAAVLVTDGEPAVRGSGRPDQVGHDARRQLDQGQATTGVRGPAHEEQSRHRRPVGRPQESGAGSVRRRAVDGATG